MAKIIAVFCIGIITGIVIRKRKTIINRAEMFSSYLVYALLFVMGVEIGTNPALLNNINEIGIHSILITISALTGSLVVALISYRVFFKKKKYSNK